MQLIIGLREILVGYDVLSEAGQQGGVEFAMTEPTDNRRHPPPEIVARGSHAVEAWSEAVQDAHVSLNEAKLVLIGDGGVEKTSLRNRLVGDAFRPDQYMTHGIEISVLQADVGGQSSILNVWDFGGQDIMHSTHQLFLSRRSIYVIVLDARSDSDPVYWLETASSFGGGSPVLIVINKTDQLEYELDEKALMARYGNIVGFHHTSCLTGHGIESLRDAIWDAARGLSLFRSKWPSSWFRVRRSLQLLTRDYKNYIDQDEFVELCLANGIDNEQEQMALLGFLHDLGLVLYFPGIALQVLNPTWVTQAIYRIINSPQMRVSGGILKFNTVKNILSDGYEPTYTANERRAILEIMKRFEISYDEVPNQTVLIPGLLPDREPEFDFDNESAAQIRCEYVFLPASVFPRLLVRLHSEMTFEHRWRIGAISTNRFILRTTTTAAATTRRSRPTRSGPATSTTIGTRSSSACLRPTRRASPPI
jgi:hypothetical protein